MSAGHHIIKEALEGARSKGRVWGSGFRDVCGGRVLWVLGFLGSRAFGY